MLSTIENDSWTEEEFKQRQNGSLTIKPIDSKIDLDNDLELTQFNSNIDCNIDIDVNYENPKLSLQEAEVTK